MTQQPGCELKTGRYSSRRRAELAASADQEPYRCGSHWHLAAKDGPKGWRSFRDGRESYTAQSQDWNDRPANAPRIVGRRPADPNRDPP